MTCAAPPAASPRPPTPAPRRRGTARRPAGGRASSGACAGPPARRTRRRRAPPRRRCRPTGGTRTRSRRRPATGRARPAARRDSGRPPAASETRRRLQQTVEDFTVHSIFRDFQFRLFFMPIALIYLQCFDAVGRQEGHPACINRGVGAGVVTCLEQGTDLHMAQLMPLPLTVSCFSTDLPG